MESKDLEPVFEAVKIDDSISLSSGVREETIIKVKEKYNIQ